MNTKELKIIKISEAVREDYYKLRAKAQQITSNEIRSAEIESGIKKNCFVQKIKK